MALRRQHFEPLTYESIQAHVATLLAEIEPQLNHDSLAGFEASEHIDWSVTGAEDIHADRIASGAVTQHEGDLELSASQTTSGTFADARIPNLAASKIASGTFADARISESSVTQYSVASAEGWVLLDEQVISAQSEVDFESLISTTYDRYRIEMINCFPSTDAESLLFRMSSNNGTSYFSADYDWAAFGFAVGGSVAGSGANSASSIPLNFGGLILLGTANARERATGRLELERGSSVTHPRIEATLGFTNSGGTNFTTVMTQGQYRGATGAIDACRLLMSDGNISGTFRLYGLKK